MIMQEGRARASANSDSLMSTNNFAIETNNLTRSFDNKVAVSNLSIAVPYGQIFGFLGPNGAGKTTTIRLLLGLIRPTSGEAAILGYDVAQATTQIRSRVGVLLDAPGIYDRLTVAQNLSFVLKAYGRDTHAAMARSKELIDLFGLGQFWHGRPLSMSYGERRKLAIVRALAAEPDLIFLDEPTAGLDVPSAVSLREVIKRLATERGVTIFLTTHQMADVQQLCDSVAIIDNGALVASGSADELSKASTGIVAALRTDGEDAQLSEFLSKITWATVLSSRDGLTRVQCDSEESVRKLQGALAAAGISLTEFYRERPDFESTFLKILGANRASNN